MPPTMKAAGQTQRGIRSGRPLPRKVPVQWFCGEQRHLAHQPTRPDDEHDDQDEEDDDLAGRVAEEVNPEGLQNAQDETADDCSAE